MMATSVKQSPRILTPTMMSFGNMKVLQYSTRSSGPHIFETLDAKLGEFKLNKVPTHADLVDISHRVLPKLEHCALCEVCRWNDKNNYYYDDHYFDDQPFSERNGTGYSTYFNPNGYNPMVVCEECLVTDVLVHKHMLVDEILVDE
jgi:hypothetical protein